MAAASVVEPPASGLAGDSGKPGAPERRGCRRATPTPRAAHAREVAAVAARRVCNGGNAAGDETREVATVAASRVCDGGTAGGGGRGVGEDTQQWQAPLACTCTMTAQ